MSDDTRTAYQRMIAGEDYVADDPRIVAALARARRLMNAYSTAYRADREVARSILADLLGGLGDDVEVRPPLAVDYGTQLTIGNRVFVNFNLTVLDVMPVTIGDDTLIGPNVQLLTAVHPLDPEPRRSKIESAKPITIGRNVWIGGGAIVLPGVTIGDDTVIGAGSVVTRDVPAGVLALGNPARTVRTV